MDRLLRLDDVVRQSAMCHPEWTAADHVMYINSEAWHLDSVDEAQIVATMSRLGICPRVTVGGAPDTEQV